MRAREFANLNEEKVVTINIPINITIPSDGSDIKVDTPAETPLDAPNGDEQSKMVPPLQQELELEKADAGYDSEVIDQITSDDEEADEEQKIPLSYK